MKQVKNDWNGIVSYFQTNLPSAMPSVPKKVTDEWFDLNLSTSNALWMQLGQGDFEDTYSCSLAVNFYFVLIKQDPLEWLDAFNTFISSDPRLGQNAVLCKVLNFDIETNANEPNRKGLKIETDIII